MIWSCIRWISARARLGYEGPLYAEICPRTFSILAREGDRLSQIRFRRGAHQTLRDVTVSVDLAGFENGIVGYRARRHAGLVDLARLGGHASARFWEPMTAPDRRLVLDPGEFYILASREAVSIGLDEAAEMAPIAPEIGEFRLDHGQAIARLVYEPMLAPPTAAYGAVASNYQAQGLKLSKFFAE